VDKTASPAARKIAALLRTADPAAKKRILSQLVSLPSNSRELPKQVQRAHDITTRRLLREPLKFTEKLRYLSEFSDDVRDTLAIPDTLQNLSEFNIDRMLRNRVALEKLPEVYDNLAVLRKLGITKTPGADYASLLRIQKRLGAEPSQLRRKRVEADARAYAVKWSGEATPSRVRDNMIMMAGGSTSNHFRIKEPAPADLMKIVKAKINKATDVQVKPYSQKLSKLLTEHIDPRRELYTMPYEATAFDLSNVPMALRSPELTSWKGVTGVDALNPSSIRDGFYSGYGPVGMGYAQNPFTGDPHSGIVWRTKRKLLDPRVRNTSIYTPHVSRTDLKERQARVRGRLQQGTSQIDRPDWGTLPAYETIYENVPAEALQPYIAKSRMLKDGDWVKVLHGVRRPREFKQRIFELLAAFRSAQNHREAKALPNIARYYGVNPADLPTS